MICYYKTIDGALTRLDYFEKDCWVNVCDPTDAEVDYLKNDLQVNTTMLERVLDEDERSHLQVKEDQFLIVLAVPREIDEDAPSDQLFVTDPISIIHTKDCLITFTLEESIIFQNFTSGKVADLDTNDLKSFAGKLIYQVALSYDHHLEHLDKISNTIEKRLHKPFQNKDLIRLLALQKSLVYYTSSITAVEGTLEKLKKGDRCPEGLCSELVEDSLIEIRQSLQTASVYTEVLASTLDTVESVISNDLNNVMKMLTSVTLVISIPNIIFGFYGMNVAFPHKATIVFPIILALTLMGVVAYNLYKRDFF